MKKMLWAWKEINLQILKDLHVLSTPQYKKLVFEMFLCTYVTTHARASEAWTVGQTLFIWDYWVLGLCPSSMMDRIQRITNPECYTSSSEPFRLYWCAVFKEFPIIDLWLVNMNNLVQKIWNLQIEPINYNRDILEKDYNDSVSISIVSANRLPK